MASSILLSVFIFSKNHPLSHDKVDYTGDAKSHQITYNHIPPKQTLKKKQKSHFEKESTRG